MIRIRRKDLVQVLCGKDKGKRGEVVEILPKKGKVKVKGVALQTRHVKARKAGQVSGIKKEEAFIAISNVMPVCPSTDKPCRINAKFLEGGKKERVSNRSGEII